MRGLCFTHTIIFLFGSQLFANYDSLKNIAFKEYNNNNYSKALDYFNELSEKNDSFLIYTAYCHDMTGNYDSAKKYYNLSFREINDTNSRIMISNNLGTIYESLGEYYQAINQYKNGLKYSKSKRNDDILMANIGIAFIKLKEFDSSLYYMNKSLQFESQNIFVIYKNIALCYKYLGNLNEAEKNYNMAIKTAVAEGEKNFYEVITLYIQYADYLIERRNNIKAVEYYNKAIDLSERTFTGPHEYKSKAYLAKSLFVFNQGDYKQALIFISKAINAIVPGYNNMNLYQNPENIKSALNRLVLLECIAKKALYFKYYALQYDDPMKWLKTSLDNYHYANRVLDTLRQEIIMYEDKLTRIEIENKLFSGAVDICDLLYRYSENEVYIHEAFKFSDKSKYQVLSDEIEIERENINVRMVQDKLNDETLIEYFIDDTVLYAFCITKNLFDFKRINIDSMFYKNVDAYRNEIYNVSLSTSDLPGFKKSSHYLYKTLIEPFKDHIKERIVIVTHSVLNDISFDALTVDTTGKQFHSLNYLVKHYAISQPLTASIYFKQPVRNDRITFSIISPVYIKDNPIKVDDLIKELKGYKGTFLRKKIQKKEFIESLNANIVHIITHGYDSLNYKKSALLIGDSILLTSEEISKLSLNNDLIILNSCETGRGKKIAGEGVMSIGRSFIAAGANSVIMSIWEATDNPGYYIFKEFYKQLSKGEPIDVALQRGKLHFFNVNQSSILWHPSYWSNYVLIGNSENVKVEKKIKMWYYILSITVILVIVTVLLKLFYKRK